MSTMNVLIFASLMAFPSLSSSAPAGEKKSEETYRVCQEPVCFERARMINDSLNTSVNPCDDFYAYACGGWIAKHPIPESKSSIGNFDLVDDELQKTLKNILGNMTLVQQNQNITDKLAAAYNACLGVPTKGDQIEVLHRLMNDSGFDQWPKMPAQGRTDANLGNCTDVLTNIPIHDLITMYVERDLKELTTYVIQMDQLDFPVVGRNQLIHPNDTHNEKIIAAYRALVMTALKLMTDSYTEEQLSQLAYRLVDFEGQLANLTTPPEERRDVLDLYRRTNISELEEDYPNVPLLNMLNKEFSYVNITSNKSETIELFADDYYGNLNDFLEDVDCDMLYNYAGLRQILGWAGRASGEFRNASLNLTKASTGVAADQQTWEKCVSTMNDLMPEIVGYIYVLDKFSIQAKEEVEDLVRRIKTVFNDTIMQSDWMDNETKIAAEQKSEHTNAKHGRICHCISVPR